MSFRIIFLGLSLWALIVISPSCTNHQYQNPGGYPLEIADILITNCATEGCHNRQSHIAAGKLDLSDWESLMEGGSGGAAVIPFSHGFSSLFLFCNTYPDLGASTEPTMPYNGIPLTREEILKIRFWINDGAPDNQGKVKFSDNPNREKYYVLNQGCDQVMVIDSETDLIARSVRTTYALDVENIGCLQFSPDGLYWYVVSPGSGVLRKYRTSDDIHLEDLDLGAGNWKNICISPDSKTGFVVSEHTDGLLHLVDLQSMSILQTYGGGGLFSMPSFPCLNPSRGELYLTSSVGNFVFRIDVNDPFNAQVSQVSLETGQPPSTDPSLNPVSLWVAPGGNQYWVACEGSSEIRIINAASNALMNRIPLNGVPAKLVSDPISNRVFISCPEDTLTFPGNRGSIIVVDATSLSVVASLEPGFQPFGMAVDTKNNRLIVGNRNKLPDGPTPHHVTECEGRNGFLTYFDLSSLGKIPGLRVEVSSDPVSVEIRP